MYGFENVTVLWGGKAITGMSDDSEVKAIPSEDAVFTKTGLQGDVAYAKNPNQSGTVSFTLFQDSASLPLLRKDAKAAAQKTLTIRDATAGTGFLLQCDNCVIQKVPEWARGKEPGKVEINIFVPRLDVVE